MAIEKKVKKTTSSKLFNTRLAAYSATATAALAFIPTTHAAIQDLTTFSYDGGSTFTTTPPDDSGVFQILRFTAATAGHVIGFNDAFYPAHGATTGGSFGQIKNLYGQLAHNGSRVSRLSLGAAVAGKNFSSVGGRFTLNLALKNSASSIGNFLPHGANATRTGYIGFKTNLRGHTYYGWMHVKVSNNANGYPFEISVVSKNGDPGIFGAFGLAGDGITAGAIAPVPEPSIATISGLGLLALGAQGVRELRRRRKDRKKV